MSGSGKKPSRCIASGGAGGGGGGSGGDYGGDEEDGVDGPTKKGCPKEESGHGSGSGAKRVSLFRFRKGKKKLLLLQRKRRRRAGSVSFGCFGKLGGGSGLGCCLCLKQPLTLDSSAESPTSDPNSKEFTYDMLRVLIEKNDFYVNECNPHLDAKCVSSSSCSHEDEK